MSDDERIADALDRAATLAADLAATVRDGQRQNITTRVLEEYHRHDGHEVIALALVDTFSRMTPTPHPLFCTL